MNVSDTSFPREMNFADELPDIPYTPMRDRSIDEGASTSSATDPPDPKRSCPMIPAERKARSRQAQSAKKRGKKRATARVGMADLRSELSEYQRKEAGATNRVGKALQRSGQSEDQRKEERATARVGMAVQ